MTTLPNFLIIGAAKSGTYALYTHFGQHPEVFMCGIKEPHYFSYGASGQKKDPSQKGPVHSWVSSRQAYDQLFADAHQGARVAGESSVSYLYVPGTAENIYQFNPDMKLIVSLRHPVDRAYSSFHAARGYGMEPLNSLAEGFDAEPQRIEENCSILMRYRDLGLYEQQLSRFYRVFPKEQIKVILYSDFVKDPVKIIRDLCVFIGVSTDFEPDPELRSNVTRGPSDENLFHDFIVGEHFVRSMARRLLPMSMRQKIREFTRDHFFRPPPKITEEERRQFLPLFEEDVRKLQSLLDRDLSQWLNQSD